MNIPRDSLSQGFEKARRGIRQLSQSSEIPNFNNTGTRALEAWFLGPKAENADELERFIVEAIRDQVFWRRNFHPSDPTHITKEMKRSPEYLEAMDSLTEGYQSLLAFLKKSVPFFSMRYQGHMNWDLTIPGILGYFAAMLYNPNNVAFEGSTATTILEILVGDDLCRMLGYSIPDEEKIENGAIRPWGHITCDGTVANIEAIWSARNLKFYPMALQAALKEDPALANAKEITVTLGTGELFSLIELDAWSILNLKADDILALPTRLTKEYHISRDAITASVSQYSLQSLGIQEFSRRFLNQIDKSPAFFVPGTKHYSFPKAAAVLGIGASNMIDVPVDKDARMNIAALKELLEECLVEKRPVYTVVAVIGSTEESAIDPIKDILALREEFRLKGLEFTVHGDAAWGGYHVSVIRDDFDMPEPLATFAPLPPPVVPLKQYVVDQFEVLGNADSITVDPHKSGYIPYPAGALCYRNSAMRDLVTFSAPVVFHGGAEPTVGIYGIEGSKPGAAAAAVYLSHRVIRPSKSGYGKIIGQALFSCKKLYARLLCMANPEDPFVVIPVSRLPAEINGSNVKQQIQFIRDRIVGKTNEEIIKDSEAMKLLAEIGPDENILAYAFNFKTASGKINTDLLQTNRLNKALYNRLSINPGEDIYNYDLIVSTTDLNAVQYGDTFINDYKRRLGVGDSTGTSVTVLRSVVMDPWLTETTKGSFLDILESEFRKAMTEAIEEIALTQIRGY
ncbi:pyridoxal phosphate-dependent decarboxylase family protein [Crenothrix polyspora]|uniref:Group II decarboxylase family protein n=1 Tax=Crenothrix polyspora TaxID=360316 RepID=A0A1R4GZJ9_9GAMM|nr:pyridoxal-dependent decarboxylase [Crenothrix polyspora]SJM89375.1 Group II decarboxylase family protein [Crenothrix polyspora]